MIRQVYRKVPATRQIVTADARGRCLQAMATTSDLDRLCRVLKKCDHPEHDGVWARLVIGIASL